MDNLNISIIGAAAALMIVAGLVWVPTVFAGRALPGVYIGELPMGGIAAEDIPGVLRAYEQQLASRQVLLLLRDHRTTVTLHELGVALDIPATTATILQRSWLRSPYEQTVAPELTINDEALIAIVQRDFAQQVTLPKNATLTLTATDTLAPVASQIGEGVDMLTLAQDIRWRSMHGLWNQPVELHVVSTPPAVHDGELTSAQQYAEQLLQQGLRLAFADRQWDIKPFTIKRLLQFVPRPDPRNPDNQILGVTLDRSGLQEYLTTTIAPEINQPAINARFERAGDMVTQFAVPQEGLNVNLEASTDAILAAIDQQTLASSLSVEQTQPVVRDVDDMAALGITSLLATGTSDFAGSPKNRIHNITVGTTRYHGLLIAPGKEFSFNEFLGPVDAAHGFKPELVIKHNVTIPEYGGGLCQVSTTAFRAAIYTGLEITQRRNHAYAVSYYGTPGFDSTIYPPYTDLRFTNNTPGYILIQTRIEGTKLSFEFWGTNDGREVTVQGPHPYDRQSDGAVKATLQQTVTKDGVVMIDETFYSRYKSPKLFPKVIATDDPASTRGQSNPTPTNDKQPVVQSATTAPSPSPTPTPRPTPKPTPAPEA